MNLLLIISMPFLAICVVGFCAMLLEHYFK